MSQTFDFNKSVLESNGTSRTLNLHRVISVRPAPDDSVFSIVTWAGARKPEVLNVAIGSLTYDTGMVALTSTTGQTVYYNFNNVTDFYAHDSGNTKVNFIDGTSDFVTQSLSAINTLLSL